MTTQVDPNRADNLCYVTMKGHLFVIPVEWVELTQSMTKRPYGHRVTKLRCACGEEQER